MTWRRFARTATVEEQDGTVAQDEELLAVGSESHRVAALGQGRAEQRAGGDAAQQAGAIGQEVPHNLAVGAATGGVCVLSSMFGVQRQ